MTRQDSKPHRRSRIGLIILLVLIVAAIAVVVLNPFEHFAQISADQGDTSEDESPRLAVRVLPVTHATLRNYIKVNGNVVDRETVDIHPEAAGKLSYLGVRIGDRVTADQVIARVDPSRPGAQFRETEIKAPVEGTVLAVNFASGATVSPQAAIVRLGMLDEPEVEVAVAERHIGNITWGTEAEVTFAAYPGRSFEGRVVRLGPVLNPATRTLTVGIELQDPQRLIKVGMFPSVVLYTEMVEDALVIGRSSILHDGNQPYVYVVDDRQQVQKRPIELGLVVDTLAEVLEGLSEGDRVVVQGQASLTDGALVRIVD